MSIVSRVKRNLRKFLPKSLKKVGRRFGLARRRYRR